LTTVRYIGNKTRLLDFIRRVLRARGITGGTAVDPFTGTASVARALKRWGFQVIASDLMEFAHVFARAYVQADGPPDLAGLAAELDPHPATLAGAVAYLNRLEPAPGFLHEHFTPAGAEGERHERMYFTPTNAARIDAVRTTLEEWRRSSLIDDDAYYILLAATIEGADRVANTAGVYAACIKSWQPNARRAFHLRLPRLTPRPTPAPGGGSQAIHAEPRTRASDSRATRAEALALVRGLEPFDLLYIDPPYNERQYPAYYHIPELIATGWFDGPVELRGKTGLLPDREKRSAWSSRRRCAMALEELVASAPCRHIVMSYNSEGLIPEATIARIFKAYGRAGTYRRYTRHYRRYRSDTDGQGRRYRGDEVVEFLFCVDR
jgi:adenine-specific DNA-methyltransferase